MKMQLGQQQLQMKGQEHAMQMQHDMAKSRMELQHQSHTQNLEAQGAAQQVLAGHAMGQMKLRQGEEAFQQKQKMAKEQARAKAAQPTTATNE